MKSEVVQSFVKTQFSLVYELPKPWDSADDALFFSLSEKAKNFYESLNKTVPPHMHIDLPGVRIPILWPDSKSDAPGDLVGSAFYFLSAYYEFANYSSHSRTPYKNSGPGYFGVIRIPIVNYYFEMLAESISNFFGNRLQRKNANTFLCLTHDIDRMNSGWLEGGLDAMKRGRVQKMFRGLVSRALRRDPWMNLIEIARAESSFNRTSTFFMLSLKNKQNADYRVNSPKIKRLLYDLISFDAEIGIHGGIGSHISDKLLKHNISKLGLNVKSNRFHFLHFDIMKTVSVLEQSGVEVDSSMGLYDEIGFRTGFTYPHYLFNFERMESSKVIELPLNAMDTTLRKADYLGIEQDEIPALFDEFMVNFERFGGVFTLLWHNNYFSEYKFETWKSLYLSILKLAENRFENLNVAEVKQRFGL